MLDGLNWHWKLIFETYNYSKYGAEQYFWRVKRIMYVHEVTLKYWNQNRTSKCDIQSTRASPTYKCSSNPINFKCERGVLSFLFNLRCPKKWNSKLFRICLLRSKSRQIWLRVSAISYFNNQGSYCSRPYGLA